MGPPLRERHMRQVSPINSTEPQQIFKQAELGLQNKKSRGPKEGISGPNTKIVRAERVLPHLEQNNIRSLGKENIVTQGAVENFSQRPNNHSNSATWKTIQRIQGIGYSEKRRTGVWCKEEGDDTSERTPNKFQVEKRSKTKKSGMSFSQLLLT